MRWFEFNDAGGALGEFGQAQRTLFVDLWIPEPPLAEQRIIGACRGMIIVYENMLICLRSTWQKLDIKSVLHYNDLEEYRPSEVFGWEMIIDNSTISTDEIFLKYFHEKSDITDYKDAFLNRRRVSGFSVSYGATLLGEASLFPTFSIALLDEVGDPVLRLVAQPEGRLACEEPKESSAFR